MVPEPTEGRASDLIQRAGRAPTTRPLNVAVEELEEAIEVHPDVAEIPPTTAIRELLSRELRELGPPSSPSSDGPGGAI